MTTTEPAELTTADLSAQLDALDDKVIVLSRMVAEMHAVFAPLLPIIEQMTGGMTESAMAGNPMLSLLGGMNL